MMNSANPDLNQLVIYESKMGDGIVSPAVVLRTQATTNMKVIERWGPTPEGTLSGKGRPEALVPQLEFEHVDLLVHGLGGDYREYNVPYDPNGGPGTWQFGTVDA